MAHDWEWVISIHEARECDVDNLIEAQSVDDINRYLAEIDDPVEVSICKCYWNEDDGMYDREHYFVNFDTMQFDSGKIPQKYQRELTRLIKPKVLFNCNMCPCCNENS
jgi:hypothetical protein